MLCMIAAVFLGADIIRRALRILIDDKKDTAMQSALKQLTKKVQPTITILVYGQKGDGKTEATVRSVRASQYAYFDVVVAYTHLPPTRSYRAAYRRSKRGEIVVCLKAGEQLDPVFLKRAVLAQYNRSRWWVTVRQPADVGGVTGVAKELQAALWGDTTSIEVCTRRALLTSQPLVRRAPNVSIVVALLLIAGACLASAYVGLQALWYIWLLFTLYLFMVLWLESRSPFAQTLKTSLGVPSALFFVPVSSLVEGIFQLATRK